MANASLSKDHRRALTRDKPNDTLRRPDRQGAAMQAQLERGKYQ